jgi:hypothetical protein
MLETEYAIKIFLTFTSILKCIIIIDFKMSECCLLFPDTWCTLPSCLHSHKLSTAIHVTSFIHLAVCLTTGPKPLPKQAFHIVRSRASSFIWEYPLLSLRSPSSFLCLLPRLPVTSISPFIFPSITCCRRQFLRKMWPIQLACCEVMGRPYNVCFIYYIYSNARWDFFLKFNLSVPH